MFYGPPPPPFYRRRYWGPSPLFGPPPPPYFGPPIGYRRYHPLVNPCCTII